MRHERNAGRPEAWQCLSTNRKASQDMRILKNEKKVYGYDELSPETQKTAQKYISNQKQRRTEYHFTVNDFEWYVDGKIMFYTHNINAF